MTQPTTHVSSSTPMPPPMRSEGAAGLRLYQQRYELTGFEADELLRLKALGLYSEIIAYSTRLFVPPDNYAVLQALLDR